MRGTGGTGVQNNVLKPSRFPLIYNVNNGYGSFDDLFLILI